MIYFFVSADHFYGNIIHMKTAILLLFFTCFFLSTPLHAQKKPAKLHRNFGEYILVDSSSTLMVPILYDVPVFTSDKMASSGRFFSNFIFYNFKTDSVKRLFEKDTYISSYEYNYYVLNSRQQERAFFFTKDHIFYKVYPVDRNKDGKIDWHDPCVLYVSDRYGNHLKALTTENQNVVGTQVFEKQNFILLKIQLDSNGDLAFESDTDRDYYLVKLDIKTKQFGPKILLAD